jgi:hypothetical protein
LEGTLLISGLVIDDISEYTDFHYIRLNSNNKENIKWKGVETKQNLESETRVNLFEMKGGSSGYHDSSSFTNCEFENFNIQYSMIYIEGYHNFTFSSCTFNSIVLTKGDGGVFHCLGNIECINCYFTFCKAAGNCGVLNHRNYGSTPTEDRYSKFTNCLFVNCSVDGYGGVFGTDGNHPRNLFLILSCCKLYNNSAVNQGYNFINQNYYYYF